VAARVAVRVREVERGLDEGVLAFGRAALQLVPLGGALLFISPVLGVGAALVLGPFAVCVAVARRRWRSSYAKALELCGGVHQQVDELVRNIDVWRVFGAGAALKDSIARDGERAGQAAARAEGTRAALSASNEVLAALALVVAVLAARAFHVPVGDGAL